MVGQNSYEAAADEPDFPEDPSDWPDGEVLLAAGLLSPEEELEEPSGDDVFSFDEPAPSLDDPVDSEVVVALASLASLGDDESLAAGRLSFL